MKIANTKTTRTMLDECIASVLSCHTGVITCKVKEKKCCIALKMNFKFYQHLILHLITPVWLGKTDATYLVSIVLGVFVLATFFSRQFFICSI